MDRDQSLELLKSSRTLDRANIFEGNTQKPFNFQIVTLDLTTAVLETAPKIFNFPFKCLYVVATTDSSVAVSFKPNAIESYQSALPLGQNDALEFPEPLSSGVFYWTAQPGKSITLVFMVNGVIRPGKLISVTSGGLVISEGSSFTRSVGSLTGAAAATSVLASNANRTVARILNVSSDVMYVGEIGIDDSGANQGWPIAPGGFFEWKNSSALFGYMPVTGDYLILEQEN